MKTYKEFTGKTLDEAISEACTYFNVAREKLEIDIVNDAKMGIFGLVGVKKATIRAARVDISSILTEDKEDKKSNKRPEPAKNTSASTEEKKVPTSKHRGTDTAQSKKPVSTKADKNTEDNSLEAIAETSHTERNIKEKFATTSNGQATARSTKHPQMDNAPNKAEGAKQTLRSSQEKNSNPSRAASSKTKNERNAKASEIKDIETPTTQAKYSRHKTTIGDEPKTSIDESFKHDANLETIREGMPELNLNTLDDSAKEALKTTILEIIDALVRPITGEYSCTVNFSDSRARISIDAGESSGLLVGREGQTLASVQYIASRILAKKQGATLRLQFDAGNYHERQDDRLREIALALAERAKATNRSQSTRPLSAYQRRIIHLALEADELIQTYSKGEGSQRKVIIQAGKRTNSAKHTAQKDLMDNTDDTYATDEEL